MKLCIDCKHCLDTRYSRDDYLCYHPKYVDIDKVTGIEIPPTCASNREYSTHKLTCGEDAKDFECKPPEVSLLTKLLIKLGIK